MARPRHLIGVLAVAGLVATACTGGAAPTADATSTPRGTSPSAAPSTPVPETSAPRPAEAATQAWSDFQTRRLDLVSADDEPIASDLDGLVTDDARDRVIDLVRAARPDVPIDVIEVEPWPRVEVTAAGDEATVTDCVLVRQARGEEGESVVQSQAWTGELVSVDDAWLVAEVSPGAADCVPADLQTRLVDAYVAWLDGIDEWWDPPSPDHPLLRQRMVGAGLEDMRAILTDHAEAGIAYRDAHDPVHAVVFELGIGTATVSDCHPADPDVGAYDAETGERRGDLTPSPTPGQHDRMSVELQRDGGDWKVSGWQSRTDADCTPGGTPYVVAP